METRRNLSLSLVVFFIFIFHKGFSLDLRAPGVTVSESSFSGPDYKASAAVDRVLTTLFHSGYASPQEKTNPWWKVDLGAVYCLRKITLVNRIDDRFPHNAHRLQGSVIRAGLSSNHLHNDPEVGLVPNDNAITISGAVIDFLPVPYVTARYVSVDIPRSGVLLNLVEVMIEEVTTDTIKIDTPSSDKALQLTGLPSSQSSDYGNRDASRAVDGSATYDYDSEFISSTDQDQNPWWKVDLTSVYCIGKIAIRNVDHLEHDFRLRLQGAFVRAGLDATPTENPTCGSNVTLYQALINDWIEFTCDPYTLARYVSVDIPRETVLSLAEVMVWPCDLHPEALNLTDKPSSQSSTDGSFVAGRAVDSLPMEPYCSLTMSDMNPWWMVDLESSQCLGQIRVWSYARGTNFQDAVVRVGLSDNYTENVVCGRQVQASSDFVAFICDPPVLARYVSVDIPGMARLGLCEVTVATCDFKKEVDDVDLTLVVNPSLLGPTGDNDSVIAVYRGPEEITSNVSFGRQVSTGGASGLPSGSGEIVNSSLGCTVRLLSLPEEGGLDRTGVFYAEATRNGLTTRIQTIILPKDESTVHIRPVVRTQTASIGDSVVMEMRKVSSLSEDYRWRRNGGDVIEPWNNLLSVSIPNVAKDDEGVYSCFVVDQENEQQHGIMRLIVRDCPSGRWGPPSCLKTCRRCYNGGVCDDESGTCVCAPGFSGDNCQQAHGRNVFGKTADQRCFNSTDPHHEACRGRLFCLPDPYGCSCAAGYMGLDCMQECAEGTFGADCKQTCHCASEGTCSKDTGECSDGCEAPNFGNNCQCTTENGVLGLEVTSGGPHQLFVAWQPDPCSSGYELTTTDECEDIVSQNLTTGTTYHFITDLKSPLNYRVHIRPLYPGDVKGPEVNFSQTRKPFEAPTEVNSTSVTSTSLSFSWSKPPCGSRGGIITGYTYILTEVGPPSTEVVQSVTSEESVTIQDLSPLTEYSFQVAANTAAGAGPYSQAQVKTTLKAPPTVSSSTAAIAGGIVAALIVILVIILLIVVFKRRRRQRKPPSSIIKGQRRGENVNHTPGTELESSMNIYRSERNAEVCPEPPPPFIPPPQAAPQPEARPDQATSSSGPVQELIIDDNEEELPYAELPNVREAQLAEYIQTKDKKNGFHADFKTLPKGVLHPATVAEKPENKTKNRYANVLAYDHSRVILELLENKPHSDYINACFIDGYKEENKYIASQGPNKGSGTDMWRMVWQYDIDKIIMLTNPVENGKVKCEQYWPNTGSKTYSDIMVKVAQEKSFLDYTIRSFHIHKVTDSEQGSRLVTQFHFKTWPDMEPPEYPTTVLNFMRVVNAERNKGRVVVHCSAGIGRTGTYIALESMIEKMRQEGQVDVIGFIYRMRQKRNKMVQTAEQYRFVYDALLAASMTGDTAYDILDYRQKLTALKSTVKGSKKTVLEKQFETLGKLMGMKRKKEMKRTQSGKLPENVNKNRFADFPALERSRPYLMTGVYANDSDYINATILPGYRRKRMYISTQMPMPHTVTDFWSMVYNNNVICIVMLNPLDPEDKTMCRYWPEQKGCPAEFGPFVVELTEINEHNSVTGRTFTLHSKEEMSGDPRTVSQFECLDWPSDEETPSSLQGMLTLMGLTQEWHEKDGPIVAHCIDGMGRSAVYCAVMSLLEQSKEEKVVDLFQAVFRLRMAHFNMMYSVEYYEMCYELLQKYLDSNIIYANL